MGMRRQLLRLMDIDGYGFLYGKVTLYSHILALLAF